MSRSASFCCALPIENSKLGLLLGGLVERGNCAASAIRVGRASSGGLKFASGSPSANSACSRATSSCAAMQIALRMPQVGIVHGRIELDQNVSPALTICPSWTWMARTTPVSNGWITLVRPLRHDFAFS